jgi:hypothetical protein
LLTNLHVNRGEDDDELGVSGYYNFDKPGQHQPEQFAIGRNFQMQEPKIPSYQ